MHVLRTLNDFSRCVIINLHDALERRMKVVKECQRIGLRAQIYPAIKGNLQLYHQQNIAQAKAGYWNSGAIGLTHTILRLLQECKQDPACEHLLILEDDCQFHSDSTFVQHHVQEALKTLPNDWEMIFFGRTKLPNVVNPCIVQGSPWLRLTYRGCFGTHCLAIHRRVFDTLIEYLSKVQEPIDITYAERIFPRGKSYALEPVIAWQAPGFSSILNRYVDYRETQMN